jgi:uncharacterized protein YfaT (DUF1175 family)
MITAVMNSLFPSKNKSQAYIGLTFVLRQGTAKSLLIFVDRIVRMLSRVS